jgi:hypothetical protein
MSTDQPAANTTVRVFAVVRHLRELRLLLWGGALLFTLGAGLDLAAHLLPALGQLHLAALGLTVETAGHLTTFAGMAVLLLGVLTTARGRRPSPSTADPTAERRPPTS